MIYNEFQKWTLEAGTQAHQFQHIIYGALTAGQDNPGYFPPIFGLFWAIFDYLRLNPG